MCALFLFVLLQVQPAADAPTQAEELFALGVELYQGGDAAGAVAAFAGAEATGMTSGMLHYNLGTAYLKLEQLGPSILQFERADKLVPGNNAVAHNLRIAREEAGIVAKTSAWTAFGSRVAQFGGPALWLLLALAFYLTLITLTGYRLWTLKKTSWSRRAITILVPATLALFVVAISAWESTRLPFAIVLSENAELRSSPSPDASSRATLHPGERVRIMEIREGWQEVSLSDGVSGWLPTRAAERI